MKKFSLMIGLLVIVWSTLLFLAYSDQKRETLDIYFLDIGQGDAALMRTPLGKNVLFDGGPDSAILPEIGKILPYYDQEIDLIVLSHPHADHLAGLVEVIKRYQVKAVVSSASYYKSEIYKEFLYEIKQQEIPYIIAEANQKFKIEEDIIIDILFPFVPVTGLEFKNLNNSSVVLQLNYGQSAILFSGDAEEELENVLIQADADVDANFLKVGHHASSTSSTEEYLLAVDPELAIISSGINNRYGHPHPDTLQMLESHDIDYLRTDTVGTIRLECTLNKCEIFK